jgi:hypothetical protein
MSSLNKINDLRFKDYCHRYSFYLNSLFDYAPLEVTDMLENKNNVPDLKVMTKLLKTNQSLEQKAYIKKIQKFICAFHSIEPDNADIIWSYYFFHLNKRKVPYQVFNRIRNKNISLILKFIGDDF